MGIPSTLHSRAPASAVDEVGLDAQLVWNTWRRILSDDALAAQVSGSGPAGEADDAVLASMSDAEQAVVADFARTPQATRINIDMYRRSLVRIVQVALGRVPLSQRLLFMSGLDVETVAKAFIRVNRYADDGPNFWRLAGAFLAYLATLPQFGTPAHQDLLALDQALAALARRLGPQARAAWPTEAHPLWHGAAGEQVRLFVAAPAATLVRSDHDLTSWIENPSGYDPAEPLSATPRHWLIYFPDADSAPDYAELNARTARLFALLDTPRSAAELATMMGDLSATEVLEVLGRLAELGVIASADGGAPAAGNLVQLDALGSEAFVMLDPEVELLDAEIDEHRFLCHTGFEAGVAVPPGEGLIDFVSDLVGQPVLVGALRKRYNDPQLVDTLLAALRQQGFLHVTGPQVPTADDLARLRRLGAGRRQASLRHTLVLDLARATAVNVLAEVAQRPAAPELHLRCARLDAHGAILGELAALRQAGRLRLHHSVVEAADLTADAALAQTLRRLGAEVVVANVAWPAPACPIAGLLPLMRAGVPVYAHMVPDRSFFDPDMRDQARQWAESAFLCGLSLELDPAALWPDSEPDDADFSAVFEAVEALGDALGDVRIANMPGDAILLSRAWADVPQQRSELSQRFRRAYVRRRIPLLKSIEGDNTFSQTPEAEEKLVRLHDDLLPNHPELLKLAADSTVVDVCGGNGRVARRLAPLLGPDGLVISVEMLRCVTDSARSFACARDVTNVAFRTGLTQRLPLPDGMADAAVNEWTGAIWQLGLGPAMLAEMVRVVRPGGRIAVTHRLVRLPLTRLSEPWIQFDDIYALMHAAFDRPDLHIVTERIWGQTVPTLAGERASAWRKHFMPRIVNPFDVTYTQDRDPGPHADVILTLIAERVR